MTRLAELASIILCTCFPMMPRLLKLVSDRRANSKSYSNSPQGHTWKRKKIIAGKEISSSGAGGASSDATEETTRLERPYEQLGVSEDITSGDSRGISWTDDVELAMPESDVRHFSDLLEQRLDMDFTVPTFSYT